MVALLFALLVALLLFGLRRAGREVWRSVPRGAPSIALLLAVVALVLFLNFRDLRDWEDSDVITLLDFLLWLGIGGWLLWPRQPSD
jgi:hypothetical protein